MSRVLALLLAGAAAFVAACSAGGPRKPEEGERLTVFASTPHLASLAMSIAGEDADVEMLPPPGSDNHSYEPTVADRRRLSGAHLFLVNGLELENYDTEAVATAARVQRVNCSAELPNEFLIQDGGDHEGHEHGPECKHGPVNPHVWLCAEGAWIQAGKITQAMSEADPSHKDAYRSRFEALKKRLEEIRAEFAPKFRALANRRFIAHHDAWPYFAREYGLDQAGFVQKLPGHDPSVAERRALEETIRTTGAKVLLVEPGVDAASARAIASSTGAGVVMLDPLNLATPAADAVENSLRKNLQTLLEALE